MGLLAGTASGLFGIGGGVIMVPALTLLGLDSLASDNVAVIVTAVLIVAAVTTLPPHDPDADTDPDEPPLSFYAGLVALGFGLPLSAALVGFLRNRLLDPLFTSEYRDAIRRSVPLPVRRGLIGAAVAVHGAGGPVVAEVVAVDGGGLVCMPLGDLHGVRAGDRVEASSGATAVPVGEALLGRVLDGLGRPIDDGPPLHALPRVPVEHTPPHPLRRRRIDTQLPLGVRALDTLVPCGRGQRVGIFAGSGVGKSSLLSMITRGTEADVTVLALIGERGREVREFIENDLGPEGLARSVVVVSTSDTPALVRLRAAFTATRVAEWFRDQGRDVLLLMDSLTRFSMAQREVGLSAGEPPATRGYPPSVFALLPKLLERALTKLALGSIRPTGIMYRF
ncbi:MAG: hypothetical protein K6T27_10145 [Thermoleophilum sp.]|nr:hypothetical protein [Thermoleophilum sp.]